MKALHRRTEEIALALVALLILAVLPLALDPFRLNLVGKTWHSPSSPSASC